MAVNIREILLLDEFLQSCEAIKREKWRYFFLFFQFVTFAGMLKFVYSDAFLICNFSLSAIVALRYRVEWGKVGVVMLIYAFMVSIPIGIYGLNELMLRQYMGYAMRILTGCFIASYFKYDFVSKVENLVFVLAYISIPLFILQIINPHIYDIFTPFSRAILPSGAQEYSQYGDFTMHQYIIIFTLNCAALNRNSGFMWEPGAYAMILTWTLMFLLYLNRFQWHRRMIVYFIAMISTFSLMGYPSLFVLLIMYLTQKTDFKKIGYVIVGGVLFLLLFSQTSLYQEQKVMMFNKANGYAINSEGELNEKQEYLQNNSTEKRVGRIAQFYMLNDIISEYPFGMGMKEWRYSSSNGLISLILKWGINAIIILVISFYNFTRRLEQMAYVKFHWYNVLMSMAVFLMPTISNPVYNRVFFLTLIVFPFFCKTTNY